MPISSNNNPTETLGGLPQPAPNNNGTKRHSLLVTLDDGTTTETQGSVTNLATLQQLQTSPTPPLPLGMFCYWVGKIFIARTYLQLPLRQWGASNVYISVLSSWKVNIAENPIAVMGL